MRASNQDVDDVLSILERLAPDPAALKRFVKELFSEEKKPKERLRRVTAALYDGLAYENWPGSSYVIIHGRKDDHRDTGSPDQGGEFHRGMPGHPDNEMGM